MQQHINCFCALSPLTVKMDVVVCAAVDVADIFAVAGVVVCALRTPSVSQIQCPFVRTLNLCYFNAILNSINKILSIEMTQKFMSTYLSFVIKYSIRDQNFNVNISDSWAPLRQLLT